MAQPPAFQFYASDFLSDEAVIRMDYDERGVYITLLALAWQEGDIPADPDQLARLLKLSRRRFHRVWPALASKWEPAGNGRLVNPRLERERAKQRRWRDKSSQGGKASAQTRATRAIANHR